MATVDSMQEVLTEALEWLAEEMSNEYAQAFGRLYAETPKAVFAAIVWSFCSEGGSSPDLATNKVSGRMAGAES